MIKIIPIASSSKGNCYYINNGNIPLLIESGIPINAIKKALDFNLSEIRGCLISHDHFDHSLSVNDIMKAGIDCFMSKGTAGVLNVGGYKHRLQVIEPHKQFNVGTWKILPFDIIHDVVEPLGFLLQSGQNKVLFLTDTSYCAYKFRKLTHIMIECNHQLDILKNNLEKGIISQAHKTRVMKNHFSLGNVIDFFNANDLSNVKGIWLMHLSDQNADAEYMKKEVQRATGKPVYVC